MALASQIDDTETSVEPAKDELMAVSFKVERSVVQAFRKWSVENERSMAGHLRWLMRAYLDGDLRER